jgi:hypothetical protein
MNVGQDGDCGIVLESEDHSQRKFSKVTSKLRTIAQSKRNSHLSRKVK